MSTNPNIVAQYRKLRLPLVANAIATLFSLDDYPSMSKEGCLNYIAKSIDSQKRNKKADKYRLDANLPNPGAEIDDIDLSNQPQIAQYELDELLTSDWKALEQSHVFAGAIGNIKNQLASAIANHFIDKATPTLAISLNKLLIELRTAVRNDELEDQLSALNKLELLFIYDWHLENMAAPDAPLLALLLRGRKFPLLITTDQISEKWFEDVYESLLPDVIKQQLLEHVFVWDVQEPIQTSLH